jgi:hypothetical protein
VLAALQNRARRLAREQLQEAATARAERVEAERRRALTLGPTLRAASVARFGELPSVSKRATDEVFFAPYGTTFPRTLLR